LQGFLAAFAWFAGLESMFGHKPTLHRMQSFGRTKPSGSIGSMMVLMESAMVSCYPFYTMPFQIETLASP
jgi:hypothetical protein